MAQKKRPVKNHAFRVDLERFVLPNGLEVYVQEDPASPTVSLSLSYKVGSRHEQKGRSGFAHLFEHLMFEGSKNVPRGEFSKHIEANGGADNAYTSLDHTNYHEILPGHLFELALWLEADRMRSLIVSQDTLDREKRVVQEEIRLRILNKPYIKALEEDLGRAAYSKWANQHSVAGTLEDVGAARLGDVRRFFETHYAPNNAVLVISGAVTLPQAKRLVKKHFAAIPKKAIPPQPDLSEPVLPAEKTLSVADPLAKLPQAIAVWHMPDKSAPEFWPLALALEHLTGGEESPLYQALVKESQIAIDSGGYFPMWSSMYDFKSPDLFAITVLYRPDAALEKVLAELDRVLAQTREKGLDAASLARAKSRMKFAWLSSFQFPFDRTKHFSACAATQGDPRVLAEDFKRIQAVTSRDTKKAAAAFLVPGRRVVMTIVPGAKEKGPLTPASGGTSPAGRGEAPLAPEVEEDPGHDLALESGDSAPESKPPTPGKPRKPNLPAIETFRLANGLDVIVVEDRTLPLLQMRLAVRAGSAAASVPGLAEAAADLVLKGTKKLNARQLAETFSGLGSRLDAQDQPDQFIFHGSLLSESAEKYFARMAEVLTTASFPAGEFDLWVKNMREELKLRRADPGFLAEERLDKRLFHGHPYESLAATSESLEAMSRDTVADFFRRHALPQGATMVLVGDMKASQAEKVLGRAFGRWGGGAPEHIVTPVPKAPAPAILLVHREDSQQANIVLKQEVDLKRSQPDFYAFQTLNQILGIGFNSRLNKNLRIKNGYTYGVYSQPELRRQASLFEIVTEVNNGVVAAAIREILSEVKGVCDLSVSADELHLARQFLSGVFVMRLAHHSRLAGQILGLRLDGIDPASELSHYLSRVQAVGAADVHRAALSHIRPDGFQIAVVGNAHEIAPQLKDLGLPVEKTDAEGHPLA